MSFASYFVLQNQKLTNYNHSHFNLAMSPTTSPIKVRKVYKFDKILHDNFTYLENNDVGFRIGYPPEDRPQVFNEKQAKNAFSPLFDFYPLGAVVFGLISQPTGVNEIYDGFTFQIKYYKQTENLNIDHIISDLTRNYDKQNGFGTKLESREVIDGISAWKLSACCYMGKTFQYYLPSKNGNLPFICHT